MFLSDLPAECGFLCDVKSRLEQRRDHLETFQGLLFLPLFYDSVISIHGIMTSFLRPIYRKCQRQ